MGWELGELTMGARLRGNDGGGESNARAKEPADAQSGILQI